MKTKLVSLLHITAFAAAVSLTAAVDARADSHVRVGVNVGIPLPSGYLEVRVGHERYYTHRGVFYRSTPHGYIVCPAPRGAVLRGLPAYCTRVYVGDVVYYRYGDVYYQPYEHGYIVVDAPKVVVPPTVANEEYQSVWVGENEFLFRDGQFFRRTAEGMVWTPAPMGAVTKVLPRDAQSVWHQEVEYFDCDGVLFKKTPEGYRVVEAPWKK